MLPAILLEGSTGFVNQDHFAAVKKVNASGGSLAELNVLLAACDPPATARPLPPDWLKGPWTEIPTLKKDSP